MYNIKNQIYQYLSRNQKSAICNYLRALVKKSNDLTVTEIWESFYADESYYLELNCSRFEFLEECFNNEIFKNETILYIKACKKYYDYKEQQKPLLEKNKEFEKKKRKYLQEVKMSKEKPTKKQLYYYDKLCKKYNIEKIELTSKLEARNEIDKIITEYAPKNTITEDIEKVASNDNNS